MIATKLLKARFLILLSLVVMLSLTAVAIVQASTPISSSGTFVGTGGNVFSVDKVAGNNLFYSLTGGIAFTGTLSGTGVLEETGVDHGGGFGSYNASGVIHFTGTIGDGNDVSAPGTIDIQYNRKGDEGILTGVFLYDGDRVFLSHTGTGGLANLHGTAHFDRVPGPSGTYEGQYHFD